MYGAIGVCTTKNTTEKLYKEIADMNIISSSIVALTQPGVSDSNKYLLYWDTGWNCWFFPNHKSGSSYEDSKRILEQYLLTEFKIPEGDCTLQPIGSYENTKYSTEHDENRNYQYTLFRGTVATLPKFRQEDGEFSIAGRMCKWMTVSEMLADEKIQKINHDVVAMVRNMG